MIMDVLLYKKRKCNGIFKLRKNKLLNDNIYFEEAIFYK